MCDHQSNCGCGEHRGHRRHGGHRKHKHHGCSCGCHGHLGPDFWTRDEKVAWLEEQIESLQKTIQKYEERIEALKGEG